MITKIAKKAAYFTTALFVATQPLAASYADDEALVEEKMIADIDGIHDLFALRYAPAEWKQIYSGWDLEAVTESAKEKVQGAETITPKEFHRILRDMCHSMQDYHVKIRFFSTEEAQLPFNVKGADGRFFISYIDRSQASESVFPFQVGCEVVAFDERPIADVIEELRVNEERGASFETDQRLAEDTLTHRQGIKGHIIPQGAVLVAIRDIFGCEHTRQLLWDYSPEQIKTTPRHLPNRYTVPDVHFAQLGDDDQYLSSHLEKMMQMTSMHVEDTILHPQHHQSMAKDKHSMCHREGFLPLLGDVIWMTDYNTPFHAYIYLTPERHRIGYLRIPTYAIGFNGEADSLVEIITKLQQQTDILILDQMNNSGGYPLFGYALLSMLTDQPLSTPKDRYKLTQEDVYRWMQEGALAKWIDSEEKARELYGDNVLGYPFVYQYFKFEQQFANFLVEEWNQGKTLTDPVHTSFLDHINPHPAVRYTKPILCLINELDFSCADFIPAILQDNNRAVLMGNKTAGAGGIVRTAWLNNSHFGTALVKYTASLAERVDKNPIENLGVTPDVPYRVTAEDLQTDYLLFADAINRQACRMLEESDQ